MTYAVLTHTARYGLTTMSTHPTWAAARKAIADHIVGNCGPADTMPEVATLTEYNGSVYAIAPTHQVPAELTDRAADFTDADGRAHVIAAGLRTNGWLVKVSADDVDGTRTVRLSAFRGRRENGACLTFTSALAKPSRSKIARCYQSTDYDTLAMRTVAAVLAWAVKAAADYRPCSPFYLEPVKPFVPAAVEPVAEVVEAEAPAPVEVAAIEVLEAAAEVVDEAAATLEAPTPAGSPIVIVACGAAKLTHAATAGEMYTGSFHRATRRAAAALAGPHGRVLILSARYGLLDLADVIDPYDERLPERTAPAEWVAMLARQAEAAGLVGAAPVVLAGKAYVHGARQVWPELAAPLEGLGGMGHQLAALAAIYAPAAAEPLEVVEASAVAAAAPASARQRATRSSHACALVPSGSSSRRSHSAAVHSVCGTRGTCGGGMATTPGVARSISRAPHTSAWELSGSPASIARVMSRSYSPSARAVRYTVSAALHTVARSVRCVRPHRARPAASASTGVYGYPRPARISTGGAASPLTRGPPRPRPGARRCGGAWRPRRPRRASCVRRRSRAARPAPVERAARQA